MSRLTLLTHASLSETLASYAYGLDAVGNRTALTETLVALAEVPAGAHPKREGLLAWEAEHPGGVISDATHAWLTMTRQSGYTGSACLRTYAGVCSDGVAKPLPLLHACAILPLDDRIHKSAIETGYKAANQVDH